MKELWGLRRAVKTFIVQRKLRNIVLLDPLTELGAASDLEKAREAMTDACHMKPAGREKIASRIKVATKDWLLGRKRKATEQLGGQESKKVKPSGTSVGPAAAGGSRGKAWRRGGARY